MSSRSRTMQMTDMWMTILVLGSLWGFAEVVLNAAIRATGVPFRAGILTGIGFALMALAVAMFGKPLMLPAIAAVTILCKQLVVPILGVSAMCKANSCLAVVIEAVALAGVATLVTGRLRKSGALLAAGGASAALTAAMVFYFAGLRLAPCEYLLSFSRAGGLLAFLGAEGVPWAAFSALLFPAGYRLGEWLRDNATTLRARQPIVYYVASVALVAACWLASAATIAAGL